MTNSGHQSQNSYVQTIYIEPNQVQSALHMHMVHVGTKLVLTPCPR